MKSNTMHQLITTLVLAATLVVAAPAESFTSPNIAARGSVQASINFFKRYDCTDDCVEIGMCLSGQQSEGMKPISTSEWLGWDHGCWDKPDSAYSLALSVNNGHKFKGINKSCKEYIKLVEAKKWNDPTLKTKNMDVAKFEVGKDKGYHHRNVLNDDQVKAIVYEW